MDFDRPYYTPMDQQYHNEIQQANSRSAPEETIFPISLIGATVPDTDPATGRGILETVQGAFRKGAGNIQLVMMAGGQAGGMGGGPKGYGEEIRDQIREIQQAVGARITGVELPNHITNLSGFTQQGFSEEARKHNLDEVRDAIKFVGDIAGGGGVNVISWEFPRNISDADWANKESHALGRKQGDVFRQREKEIALLVDSDTGKIQPFDKTDKFYLYYDKDTLKPLVGKDVKPSELNWQQVAEIAKREKYDDTGMFLLDKYSTEKRIEQLEGQKTYYDQIINQEDQQIKALNARIKEVSEYDFKELKERENKLKEDMNDPRVKDNIQAKRYFDSEMERLRKEEAAINDLKSEVPDYRNQITELEKRKENLQSSIRSLRQEEAETRAMKDKYKPVDEYAADKSKESYAEAGIWAMQETQKNEHVKKQQRDIHVGPELSWPQFYGSHPDEWIGLIRGAREKMVEKLTKKEIEDPMTHQKVRNEYYTGVSENEAKELAKKHIKGELDTGHLGMWMQNFRPDLPWDKRVPEFKKWYKEQIEHISEVNKKEDIVGEVQVVDSASGQHAHLPPGQGFIGKDIVEYMKILKEKGGYKGALTSEGHEEERFGQGRILTKAWETFGSHIGTSYFQGRAPSRFSDIRMSYAQQAYGTTGIFQSYVPSNDFTLWSQVPLE